MGKLGAYGGIKLNGEAQDYYTIWGADWGNFNAKTLSGTWNFPGRWAVDSIKGDPESSTDNYLPLTWWQPWLWGTSTWPCYYFGYWKVKVGDKVYFIGEGGFWSRSRSPIRRPRRVCRKVGLEGSSRASGRSLTAARRLSLSSSG